MYDLLCEYFSSDAVEGFFILLLAVPLIGWRIAVALEGKAVPGFWKARVQSLGRVGISLGICCILFFAYSTQKDEQKQAQQQVVVELFSSITEVLGPVGEAISNLRNYLTPEEKKSRLLPVGLATNATAWVAESQCVTSQVREAWQRVPIRRAAYRQALPFPVTIGDNAYNEVFISSSGVIGFDAPKGSELTREMPYAEAADHVYLALLWGRIDFKPRLGSKMWCGLKADGNFVASYDTVFIDGDTNAVAKVQVEFIDNGDMILRYSDLPPCATNAHVAGFQNLDGGWTLPFDNIRSNTALYLKSFGPLDLTVEDSDTDGDGISDYYELYPTNSVSITDPCNSDSDGDGLMDGEEVSLYATDPGTFSSDASGQGDLWRILGGLDPTDAPYTNAAPSGSVGILTVTTVLEGTTTNGGAVLRIADHYIPVLFGTTLVSRIAVPRDATNLFILARGANCDNAIAHITVEASTFTKIRDPSGVFGWSFTLSPSCVTASGAIIMPSYTITPSLVCFHCPTSNVCRITSADPDIYFVTTLGMVREYTPPTPEMQTNSFSIGAVQIQLACMNMALSTRASVTNIPCHLCNPDSGADDEYPDGEYYSTWCKFVNGVHVWADGYGPTNCPCLPAFTNAFECICSGDGRKPCTCAHAVSDPKAMPLNADQTNVLGHAVLKIGGTNDLLAVTVPQGGYRPCQLCGCASGVPSSAAVYRQTSCISATPGSLTADGAFSVAGISPSTNFADTVFMYKITDYSVAQTVTSYTRKDYTVLGTSVYPTDPGHSVSNWFIGCNVTNALTLWTGVKLPYDTGEVTLSVSVESGTPGPQLYVYNRIAMTNELLVTQGHLTFTQNLGDWRDTYCDTNGHVQAYLLCASGGVARVTHSYETYSGQPYSVVCSSEQRVAILKVESIQVASPKLGTSSNPPPFAGGTNWIFCVTNSPSPDKHAVVLYKDVVDGSYNVQNFDVTLTATLAPSGITTNPFTFHWEKISGPASGELMSSTDTSAVYRNPKQGGVYRFRLTVRNGNMDLAFGEANLVLPLAGAEMDSIMSTNLPMANAFVARVKSRYSPWACQKISNLEKWFVNGNAGDYVGRPDNQATPSVWYYGQVSSTINDNYGLGSVCTWKGRPVRLTKLTDFLVAYTIQQLGVNYYRAKIGVLGGFGTGDGVTASKSWDEGWYLARDGGNYDTIAVGLVNYIWTHEDADDKSRKPWPNPNPPDNDGVSPWYDGFDIDRAYAIPGFLNWQNP